MRFVRVLAVVTVLAAVFVPAALALRFTDESYFVPVGFVGEPYNHKFDGAGGCGPGLPYQFRILNGSLPPGLTLSKDGRVSGTPTVAGTWNVWIELSDQNPPEAPWCFPKTAEREFQFVIVPGVALTTASVPPGTIGAAYSAGLTLEGTTSATWSVSEGQLPPGLTLSPAGVIAGIPTTAGTYTFTIRAGDERRAARRSYTIAVRPPLAITAAPVPAAEVGVAFGGVKVTASGGSGSNTWTLEGGLPAGLTFNAQNAEIVGTPSAAGTFAVKVVAKDNEGRAASVDVKIVVSARLAIITTRLTSARVGRFYAATVKTRGGVAPVRLKAMSGRFATGLRLNLKTGLLSGKPQRAGVYRVVIQARDRLGVTVTRAFVLNVRAAA